MQKRTYRKVTVGETAADPSQPSPCPGAAALAAPETGMQGLGTGRGQGRPGVLTFRGCTERSGSHATHTGWKTGVRDSSAHREGTLSGHGAGGDGGGCPLLPTVTHPPPCLSGEAVSVTTSSWPLAGRSGPGLGNGLWAKATD